MNSECLSVIYMSILKLVYYYYPFFCSRIKRKKKNMNAPLHFNQMVFLSFQ